MAPSAPPLYGQPEPATTRSGYEVTVNVDQQYLQAAWPPRQRHYWQPPPPEYVPGGGVVLTERDVDMEAIPFFPNRRSSENDAGLLLQRRPRRDRHSRADSIKALASTTARLTMFHLLNACLGFAACSVVTSGASLGLSTLAMCCLGILVFRILFYVVYAFAQFDMMLGNYVAPPDKFMYAVIPPFDGQGVLTGYRLAPTLACFSPLSLMALLYFCSVKVGVATVSIVAVGLFLVPPITFVVSCATGYAVPIQCFGIDEVSVQSDPVGFTLSVACMALLGWVFLHIGANLSLLATRFFVCERFTVQRYSFPNDRPSEPFTLHHPQQHPNDPRYHLHHNRQHHQPRRERRPIYPVAVVSYGTA